MSPVQPGSYNGGDEELRSVGIFTSVSHGKEARLGVFELEIFICEFVSVDGFSTSSVSLGEIPALDHEIRNYTVETGTFIAESVCRSGQFAEIFSGDGYNIIV